MNWQNDLFYVLNEIVGGRLSFWLKALSASSALLFFGSLALSVVVILRLPEDFFVRPRKNVTRFGYKFFLHFWLRICRNVIGFFVLLAGLLMLVLPGQGLLTILVAFFLMDFPYKHELIEKILAKQKIRDSLNWVRHTFGRSTFSFESRRAERQKQGARQLSQ